MYTDLQIKDIFDGYIYDKDYFERYVSIYKYYKTHDCESDRYNFHHFFPCNYTKEILERKNRYWTIEEHDKIYSIEDNIVKLPVKWHVIAHFCLAMATNRKDDINSFYTLVGDYNKDIYSYKFDDVQDLAQLVEENATPNTIDHYVTQSERKEMYKEQQKSYREQWKEEHKDEIEERKKQQREYAKKMREEWKKNHSKNK